MTSHTPTHRWRFFRAGGLDQVRFVTADDYRNLPSLDQKLWVALSCPVKGIEFDERTLEWIDLDHDGRIRATEVIAAVEWVCARLKDPMVLQTGSDTVPLDEFQDATPAGKILIASARQILKNLGKPDANTIALADVADTSRIFAQTRFNGDGIVPPESAEDPAIRQAIQEIGDTEGTEPDRSGRPGITQEKADTFFDELKALDAWDRAGKAAATVSPLGDGTAAAATAVQAIRGKVDDYFARCRLAAFDARALGALNRKEEEYLQVTRTDLDRSAREVAGFPLARIEAGRPLPLREGINPAWKDAMDRFCEAAVLPIVGPDRTSLSEAEWTTIQARIGPYEAWIASKPAVPVESLGLERIRAILASTARDQINGLILQDKALEAEANATGDVEKLIRLHRDLHRLLLNFVNFADFYSSDRPATFQSGTLYLDGRACGLCLRVDDAARHAALAGLAKIFLAYCDCTRVGAGKLTLAVAYTNGDSDNLMVGRNGVFYDNAGRDWDATITKIIDNPINIRQAFWAPYKKLVRLIEEQVAKRAASADSDAEKRLSAAAAAAAALDKTKPIPPKKVDTGTVAALGVALGFIATALTGIIGYAAGLFLLPFWQLVLAFAGLLLVVSGPSILIAWLKLRQRNLGPILDANGWAVNGRVKVPVPLGRALTQVAKLPPGSVPALDDRFAEPPVYWPKLIGFVIAVAFFYSLFNHYGYIHKWTGGQLGIDRGKSPIPPSLFDKVKEIAAPPQAATNAPPAATNAPAAK